MEMDMDMDTDTETYTVTDTDKEMKMDKDTDIGHEQFFYVVPLFLPEFSYSFFPEFREIPRTSANFRTRIAAEVKNILKNSDHRGVPEIYLRGHPSQNFPVACWVWVRSMGCWVWPSGDLETF